MNTFKKRIVLKLACLIVLTGGIFALPADAKANWFDWLYCPEGTILQNGECICVCFDEWGNCTYSWTYCPIGGDGIIR